jgi:hypothetical protein
MNISNNSKRLVARLLTPTERHVVSGGAEYVQDKGSSGDYCMYSQSNQPYSQSCGPGGPKKNFEIDMQSV